MIVTYLSQRIMENRKINCGNSPLSTQNKAESKEVRLRTLLVHVHNKFNKGE